MRLNRFIAVNTEYSRRDADDLIFSGFVTVNGQVVLTPGYEVNDDDQVSIKGKLIKRTEFLYVKFYKPRGFLTSYGDAHGRKNLEDFEFFKKTKIPYSGRLDYDSEGLILFSNDGSLIHKLQTPKFDIEKEYIVYTNKPLKDEAIAEMENGLIIDGIRLKKCYISKIGRNKYKVIILEGKKRQIRKMFGYFKVEVERLIRVRIGNVTIDDLQVGEFKFLTKKELKGLKECIGLE